MLQERDALRDNIPIFVAYGVECNHTNRLYCLDTLECQCPCKVKGIGLEI